MIFIRVVPLPAFVMLGFWFALQLLSAQVPGAGGVAFWAHVAGFVAGIALIPLFRSRRLVEAKRGKVQLDREELPFRGWI